MKKILFVLCLGLVVGCSCEDFIESIQCEKRIKLEETYKKGDLMHLKKDHSPLCGVVYEMFDSVDVMMSEEYYKDGINYKSKRWYRNGILAEERTSDFEKYWHRNGQLLVNVKYNGDDLSKGEFFDEYGNIVYSGTNMDSLTKHFVLHLLSLD